MIEFGFISSHAPGGQHTNGPDYGKLTARSSEGVYIEIQTHAGLPPHLARRLATEAIERVLLGARFPKGQPMTTLRDRIANLIREHGYTTLEAADAILAAVIEHATSDEAVERACDAFDPPPGEVALWDVLSPCIRAAIGGE